MKAIYKCDFCSKQGTADVIEKHEVDCVYDPSKKSCYTCANLKGMLHIQCTAGIEIPEGKYFQNCSKWTRSEKDPENMTTDDFLNKMFGWGSK